MRVPLRKYLFLAILTLAINSLISQTFKPYPNIQLKGKFKSNKLWLRWVVYDKEVWYHGLSNGYILKKYKSLGENKIFEWSKNIKPVNKSAWPRSADTISDAEGLFQLIYFTDKELVDELPKNEEGKNFEYSEDAIKAIRHAFCFLAANNNFQSARLQGIAYEDTELLPGIAYEYVLHTAADSVSLKFDPKLIMQASLPPIMNFELNEININFNWDGKTGINTYHGYVAEVSSDGNKFNQTNSGILSNLIENGLDISFRDNFYWQDSLLPGTDKWYRLRGVDYFGELNNPGPVVKIHTPDRIPGPIAVDYIMSNNRPSINWYFDPHYEDQVSHFQVWAQDSLRAGPKLLVDNIHRSQRSYEVEAEKETKYYSIHLIRTEGNISMSSFPIMVIPEDITAPVHPIIQSAFCDSLGRVFLQWYKNTESDMAGYRVFRSNDPNDEFSQVTYSPLSDSFMLDSINLNTLSPDIFYKIAAEDNAGNLSTLSPPIRVHKYDTIPPSPPQIYQWIPSEKSIRISWYPSSSIDVAYTVLLKKSVKSQQWNQIRKLYATDNISSIIDNEIDQDSIYQYALLSIDNSGNQSPLAEPVTARSLGVNKYPQIEAIQAGYDSTDIVNVFSWQYAPGPVAEFWIYRSIGNSPLTLATTLEGVVRSWIDHSITKGYIYTYRIKALMQNGRESYMSKAITLEAR